MARETAPQARQLVAPGMSPGINITLAKQPRKGRQNYALKTTALKGFDDLQSCCDGSIRVSFPRSSILFKSFSRRYRLNSQEH
jgi:hypothetical protein